MARCTLYNHITTMKSNINQLLECMAQLHDLQNGCPWDEVVDAIDKDDYQQNSVLDGIPNNLPELLKAVKLTKRAAVIGFDWPSIEPVFTKMEEEIAELKEAIQMGVTARIKDELGDVLFVCTNLARHLRLDPQLALRHANKKFEKRFRAIESAARNTYPQQNIYDLKTLEDLWIEVKKTE